MIELIEDPDVLDGYNSDALGYRGTAEGLYRPSDTLQVKEILGKCYSDRVKVTPTALRSSTTGSCVCHEGMLLSTESMSRIIDIRKDTRSVVVEVGVNLGELKKVLMQNGLFFPPDPTSENECTVGGAVATNASGARTLKYGATRRWIRRIKVILPSGEETEIPARLVDKNAAGYFGFQDPIQFFIGSEGTLGVITEVELQCIEAPKDYIAIYAFFPDEVTTLEAAVKIRERGWDVRCLEYFDKASLKLLRSSVDVQLPANAGGMLFFEEEAKDSIIDELLEAWIERLDYLGARIDDTMVGNTLAKKEEMKSLRHAIPATLNERGISFSREGGGKVSTDWAVPYDKISSAISKARVICREIGIGEVYCYGHIGNGHPHFNLLARNAGEKKLARKAVHEMCRFVCKMGGTISAEHGIGKVKREYLIHCFDPIWIEWMKEFKTIIDPHWIMAPGNIFPENI